MARYFIEVAYNGKAYAGFQKQQNANTIQAEVEKAMYIYFRTTFDLTGSSRTDAGVHAKQNFFHFDTDINEGAIANAAYHINAILPSDIVVKTIRMVKEDAHCRFDATFRRYKYKVYSSKDPFLQDAAFFFPYKLNKDILEKCSQELMLHSNFQSFSKRNSQVFTYHCNIQHSQWQFSDHTLIYTVQANRFLRGMVKGLVATMLKMATTNKSIENFRQIIESHDCAKADFSAPSHGLTLLEVGFLQ